MTYTWVKFFLYFILIVCGVIVGGTMLLVILGMFWLALSEIYRDHGWFGAIFYASAMILCMWTIIFALFGDKK